jgi:hypothetical protein
MIPSRFQLREKTLRLKTLRNTHRQRTRESVAGLFRLHKLPAFLIIGAQKAGTTSLASYLAAHPSIISPSFKEVHFFDLNYDKGTEWYRSHFPIGARRRVSDHMYGRNAVAGDATPYYVLHPMAAYRASKLIPSAKIIILLRDPVARAYSHYHHEARLGHEDLSFEDAIEAEASRIAGEADRLRREPTYQSFGYQHFTYLERGIYWAQIRHWLSYFPQKQFLILSSEQLFESPASVYRRVLKFLALPAFELPAYPAEHVGRYPPMSTQLREQLLNYYAQPNDLLKKFLNSNWPGSGDAVVDRFSLRAT